jgi:hypothetical protein
VGEQDMETEFGSEIEEVTGFEENCIMWSIVIATLLEV